MLQPGVPSGADGRGAARGGSRGELFRLGILAILAVVVGGSMLSLIGRSQRDRQEAREAAQAQDPRFEGGPARRLRQIEEPTPADVGPTATPTTPGDAAPGQAPAAVDGGTPVPPAGDGAPPPADVPRPPAPPFIEDPAILKGIQQGSDEIEPAPLYHLLHKMVTADPAALQGAARAIRYERLLTTPDQYVGQPVRFTGRLAWLTANNVEWSGDPLVNPSRVTAGLWGLLADSSWRTCHFYAADIPLDVRVRDIVEVEGYFLKVYEFEADKRRTTAPLLIARNFRTVRPPVREPIRVFGVPLQIGPWKPDWLGLVLVGVLFASVPLILWYIRVERRRFEDFRKSSIERARREFAGARGVLAPAGVAASPPEGPASTGGAPAPDGPPAPSPGTPGA